MFPVFSCFTGEHDWRLVMLAGVVCVLASLVAVGLLHRTPGARARAHSQLRQQNIWLDAALNNMSQGLCMLNADEEIVVFNRRFLEMYKLSPQVVKPGCKFRDLIQHRKEAGMLDAEPKIHYRSIIDDIRLGKTTTALIKTTAEPAYPGDQSTDAWRRLGDHARRRHRAHHAEDKVREQKLQMDAALDNMSQGLLMFDADTRLVLCNHRYLQLYGLSADAVKPGLTLQ